MTPPPKRGAPRIKALFFDVDGVLTDGRVYVDDEGREFKVFDTKDGHGVKMAIAAGLRVAWISGRRSKATEQRARELGVTECHQGVADKGKLFDVLRRRWDVAARETAALGDDEPDIPMLTAAGFSACPCDAASAARKAAHVVLKSAGGRGAAREFVEHILRYNKLVEKAASSARARAIAFK